MALLIALVAAGCGQPASDADAEEVRAATTELLAGLEDRSIPIGEWFDSACLALQAVEQSLQKELFDNLFMPDLANMSEQDLIDSLLLEDASFLTNADPRDAAEPMFQYTIALGYFETSIADVDAETARVELVPTAKSARQESHLATVRWRRVDGELVLADCPFELPSQSEVERATTSLLDGFANRTTPLSEWLDPACMARRLENSSSALEIADQQLLGETFADFTDEDFAEFYAIETSGLADVFPFNNSSPWEHPLLTVQVALASGFFEARYTGSGTSTGLVEIRPTERSTRSESIEIWVTWKKFGDRLVLDSCALSSN